MTSAATDLLHVRLLLDLLKLLVYCFYAYDALTVEASYVTKRNVGVLRVSTHIVTPFC